MGKGVASLFLVSTRRWLNWITDIARDRIITYQIIAIVAVYGVVFRTLGLGRSLWLDEVWEANAIIAPSLRIMFYHSSWLPTCPPLFLVLVRIMVEIFGLSNRVLRIIPSLMGLLSALAMVGLAARLLSKRFALLASAMFIFSPAATEFSRTLKQYSSELAVTTAILLLAIIYLEHATLRRFWMLTGMIVLGLLMAYSVAFLLPGIVLVVCFSPACSESSVAGWNGKHIKPFVRAFILATLSGGILIGEYLVFVWPNLADSSALRVIWATWTTTLNGTRGFARAFVFRGYDLIRYLPLPGRLLERMTLVGATVVLILLFGVVLAWRKYLRGNRIWLETQVICLLPCLLLVIADRFHWYPMVERTGLFLLPCIIMLVASSLQLTFDFIIESLRRDWLLPFRDVALVCVTLLVIWVGIHNSSLGPFEDVAGAVSFLR